MWNSLLVFNLLVYTENASESSIILLSWLCIVILRLSREDTFKRAPQKCDWNMVITKWIAYNFSIIGLWNILDAKEISKSTSN